MTLSMKPTIEGECPFDSGWCVIQEKFPLPIDVGCRPAFQQMLALPEKNRRAIIRHINSLVAAKAPSRG